jgi:hypothetical protein
MKSTSICRETWRKPSLNLPLNPRIQNKQRSRYVMYSDVQSSSGVSLNHFNIYVHHNPETDANSLEHNRCVSRSDSGANCRQHGFQILDFLNECDRRESN